MAARMAPRAATSSTGKRCRRRPAVRSPPETGFESRPREVADMAGRERVAFLGLGIMGAPMASVRIGERLRKGRLGFLDAPVSGSRPKAEAGTLTIMAGGTDTDFERGRPVLDALGELVVHVGPQGHGSMVKLINNTLAALNAGALAEALVLAREAKLDTDALRRVVAAGSGASAMLDLKAEPMLTHNFAPLFKL